MTTDLLLINGRFWTGNPAQPEAEAVGIAGNRIVFVGAANEMPASDSRTRTIDLRGKRVVPGFNDAHVHLFMGGESLSSVDLRGTTSVRAMAERLGRYAQSKKQGAWIRNGNWNDQAWEIPALPNRHDIDAMTPHHPVFVHRSDGHMCLANSLAMELAGVDQNTPDVPGGEVVRDGDGRPTGIFKDNAKSLIEHVIPPASGDDIRQCLEAAQRYACENGVTSVHDMGVLGKHGGETMTQVLRVYQEMMGAGSLQVRVSGHLPLPEWKRLGEAGIVAGFGNDMLRIGAVKSFSDGSLGSTTAWFFEPYCDAPDSCGLPADELTDPEAMYRNLCDADSAGLQLAIHAIGDRANHTVLNLLERLQRDHGRRDRRWRIEHAQHVRPEDFARFGALGVIASVQPYHLVEDGSWAERRIGPERSAHAFAFRSLLDAGARLALGSDWWVAPMNPLLTIHAAVTRVVPGAWQWGWNPQQRITVEQAVAAYTMGGAFASGEERVKGSIEPGKLADLAVLSQDIFHIPPAEIRDAAIDMTIFDGRVVFENAAG